MKFNRFMRTVRLPEQEEELRELVKDNIVNSAVKFFVTIGFTPIVVKPVKFGRRPKDVNKLIIFYPETLISLDGWSSYSTRYRRDNWTNGESIKIYFDRIAMINYNLVFLAGKKISGHVNVLNLTSSRIVVFSKSERDLHPTAILYLDPTNSYTYAEWKNKKYVSGKVSIHTQMAPNENIYDFLLRTKDKYEGF
jgi:hypothetical protein